MADELDTPPKKRRAATSASYSITMRLHTAPDHGIVGTAATAIAQAGGVVTGIDVVESSPTRLRIDVTCSAADGEHAVLLQHAVAALEGVEVHKVSDRTFLLHLGGKIEVTSKVPLKTRDDLSMAYTPGVARVSQAIAEDPAKAWALTIKQNTVAVVSDGSAVLGLGNVGPAAALPVMEGKAVLFKEFGGVDAFPICVDTRDSDEIVRIVTAIAPVFGGVNLEDIASPRCFEIERRLRETLDIPIFHDDQHGTAIVVLAGLLNALRVVRKPIEDVRVVVVGVGAAGIAVTKTLLAAGVTDIVGCDRHGVVHEARDDLTDVKRELAAVTNPRGLTGTADEALAGADVFIGLAGPRAVSADAIRTMAADAIVFAMANPTPEVLPEEIEGEVAVIATGRSDYPNQINNVLAFPGIFRGALDVRASTINEEMELAAAQAIAAVVDPEHLAADYVIPSVFNKEVAPAVAHAVSEAAIRTDVARREWRS